MNALEQAQQDVNTLSQKPNKDILLFLYAHYKQATTVIVWANDLAY